MINYKIKTASKLDIQLHLKECDRQFTPSLSSRVDIKDYAQKIYDNAITFEAWNERRLVGFIAIYYNRESKSAFISNVSVLGDYEQRGIASELLKILKIDALKRDILKLSLEVNFNNDKAILFYKKHNFNISSKSEDINRMICRIQK